MRYLGSAEPGPGSEIDELAWSGDGRQVAWLSAREPPFGVDPVLTMVDVESGVRRQWTSAGGSLTPGTTGVVVPGGFAANGFTQYQPDGSEEKVELRIPPPPDPDRTEPPTTSVLGAIPAEGVWLVAAESDERLSMAAESYRVFRFDSQRPRYVARLSVPERSWLQPTRLDDSRVLWIDRSGEEFCREDDRLAGYRARAPLLPVRPDGRAWKVRHLIVHGEEVEVLARGTGAPQVGGEAAENQCVPGERSYRRLSLRGDRWVEREDGLVELDVAGDGRVARVHGEVCTFSYDLPGCDGKVGLFEFLRFGRGHLDFPDGSSLSLPPGVQLLRFSPAVPIRVRRATGGGPGLSAEATLGPDGFGPLRFGATPGQLQAATTTALRFDLDERGCGSVVPADATVARELGVEGELVDGRLTTISSTTFDRPVDEEHPPLSELQPDVSAVEARGPRTDRGVRAGDPSDRLLTAYGAPARTDVDPATGIVTYAFVDEGSTLTASVDEAAVVRRLEFGTEPGGESCSG